MRILPKTPAQQIERLSVLVPTWGQQAGAIGLPSEIADELKDLLAAAKEAHAEALRTREAARNATRDFEVATARLMKLASAAVGTIKSNAQLSPAPNALLARASLPEQARKRTHPPLASPHSANVTVDQIGRATITWKTGAGGARGLRLGRQSRGGRQITYNIERQTERMVLVGTAKRQWLAPDRVILGSTGRPTFTDETPPPGRTTYTIYAQRGEQRASTAASTILCLPTAFVEPASPMHSVSSAVALAPRPARPLSQPPRVSNAPSIAARR